MTVHHVGKNTKNFLEAGRPSYIKYVSFVTKLIVVLFFFLNFYQLIFFSIFFQGKEGQPGEPGPQGPGGPPVSTSPSFLMSTALQFLKSTAIPFSHVNIISHAKHLLHFS